MILPSLRSEGIVPIIYTRDPNVSNELLRTLTAGADCMRVMKRLLPGTDDDPLYRRVSAGLVTYGDKLNAINMILLSKRHARTVSLLGKISLYGMVIGAVIAAAVALFLKTPVPSLVFGCWQLLLSATSAITGRIVLHKERTEK